MISGIGEGVTVVVLSCLFVGEAGFGENGEEPKGEQVWSVKEVGAEVGNQHSHN